MSNLLEVPSSAKVGAEDTPSLSPQAGEKGKKKKSKKEKGDGKKKKKKKKGLFGLFGGEAEDEEDSEVVEGEGESTKSSSSKTEKKGFFGSLGQSLGNAFAAAGGLLGNAMSAVNNAFASKEDEDAKRARLAEEAAAAEEKRQREREEEKRLNELERKRKAEQELIEREKELDETLLGHPTMWKTRYKTGTKEIERRAWYDASTFSWDGSVFVIGIRDRQKNIPTPASKLRIFCSSTFTDTHKERNRLLGPVYKKVRTYAESRGIDFSFIDMRYGVRDENTLDHNTWEACKAELIRCKEESANLFFLSLQGQKYGYQCLPKYIPQEPFDEARSKRGTKETKEYARTWYLLDTNQVPPRYALKNLTRLQLWATAKEDGATDEYDNSYWDMFDRLRNMLDGVPFDPEMGDELTIGQSVTAWELIGGTADEEACKRAYWMHRDFVDNKVWPKKYQQNGPDKFAYWDFNDTHIEHCNEKAPKASNEDYANPHSAYNQERAHLRRKEARLQALKQRMRDRLGVHNNIQDFRSLDFSSVQKQDNFFKGYINRFVEMSEELLLNNVTASSEVLAHWAFDGCGRGIDGTNLSEFAHHINWAQTKIRSFEGRDALVARCVEAVAAPNRLSTAEFEGTDSSAAKGTLEKDRITPSNAFQGLSLAVVGASGSGKTALVARVTQAVKEKDVREGVKRLYVVRFCGTSNASTDALGLVQSICRQIVASTQEPVEPLAVGSRVRFLLDGYAWVKGTICKAHDDSTFDIEYAEGVDNPESNDRGVERTPATPLRGGTGGDAGAEKKKKKKAEKATNQKRERIRLLKSSQDDFLYTRSEAQVKLDEKDLEAEVMYMAEAAAARAAKAKEEVSLQAEAAEKRAAEEASGGAGDAVKQEPSPVPALADGKHKQGSEEAERGDGGVEAEEGAQEEPAEEEWFGEEEKDDSAMWRDALVERVNADGTLDLTYTTKDGLVKIRKTNEPKANVRAKKRGTKAEGKIWNFGRVPDSYEPAVNMLQRLLARFPVVLVVDSLDQLNNNYRGRSEVSFLRGVVPHPLTRIIVSTLPDDQQYFYLCDTRLERSSVPRVTMEPLVTGSGDLGEVRAMAEAMLAKQSRTLTPQQWAIFETSVLAEPTALYVNLAVNSVLCKWPSYITAPAELQLTPTVRGLIGQIFDTLERDFGKTLVDAALIILTLSVEGVSDVEMQDLLSIDDKVLNFVFQYSRPDIERLPYHVWLRIRASLGSLLVEKQGGCLAWYHRQLREVGLRRFSSEEKGYYSALMGRYFGNLLDRDMCEARLVKSQALVLNDSEVFLPDARINRRRCVEASHHLIEAGMYDAAIDEMCSVEAIYANARNSLSHCFLYLERALHLHSTFARMKSMGMRRSRRIAREIGEILEWQARRADIVSREVARQMESVVHENPDVTDQAAGIVRDLMTAQLADVRKAVAFQRLLTGHPDADPEAVKENLMESLVEQFPLKMRSIVEHLGDASARVMRACGAGSLDDDDAVASASQEEQDREDALAELYEERAREHLDYPEYVRARIAKLKRDLDVLSWLRSERARIMDAKKEEAFARLRAEAKFFDKAKVQRFYLEHLQDVRKCRSFISKYKMTDRSDPDRDAARAVLEDEYPVPVGADSFPERMVSLAEDIVRALGEHWAAAEADLREILFESAEQIFRHRDIRARKAISAQIALIQTDCAGVDHHKLRGVARILEESFDPHALSSTLQKLKDKGAREEMNRMLPLEEWREEARAAARAKAAAERKTSGATTSAKSGTKGDGKDGKGSKSVSDHLDELASTVGAIVQECGADASDDIEEVFSQRQHEMEELKDVYQTYLKVVEEQRQVEAWLENRDNVIQGYLKAAEDSIRAQNDTADEASLTVIFSLLREKLGSLKLARSMQGALEGDESFAYVGNFAKIREALNETFRTIRGDEKGSDRVLRMAREVLALFEEHDQGKEAKYEAKQELVDSEREECEFLISKYRMFLMQIGTLRKWVRDRDSVIAFSIRECLHKIEDTMPAATSKQLRAVDNYLVDHIRTLGGAKALVNALERGSDGKTAEELRAQLDANLPLSVSRDQVAADEDARTDFYTRKQAREARRAQEEAEAALLADALTSEGGVQEEEEQQQERASDDGVSGGDELVVESSPLGLDHTPFGDDPGLSIGIGGLEAGAAPEDGGQGQEEQVDELDGEYPSPLAKFSLSHRLCELVQAIYQRMEDSNFDMVDNDASAAAKDLGIAEMEELEVIFQSYRNPRLAHLRKFEHYQRLLQREMSFISRDPINNTYLACERQPYLSEARKDFLSLFTRFKRSKKVLSLSQVSHHDQVVPLCRSLDGLSHTFGPLVSLFQGHVGGVHAVCVSPDEEFVVSGGKDKTIKVWDSGLGSVLLDLEGHEGCINGLCVTPDSKSIISASADGSVRTWERKTGKLLQIMSAAYLEDGTRSGKLTSSGHRGAVLTVAVSPDGTRAVSGGEDCAAMVWDLSSGMCVQVLDHDTPVRSVCFTPDGTKIVTGSGSSANIADIPEAASKGTKKDKTMDVPKEMAEGTAGCICVYDALTFQLASPPLRCFHGHISSVAASDKSVAAAGSSAKDIIFYVFELSSGARRTFKGHLNKCVAVDMSADGSRVVSGGWDDTARLWNADTCHMIQTMEGHAGNVNQVRLAASGTGLYTASSDENVGVWDPSAVKNITGNSAISDSICCAHTSDDGNTVVVQVGNRDLKVFSVLKGKHLCDIECESAIACVALSPDASTVAVALMDKCVYLWRQAGADYVQDKRLEGHTEDINAVCVSANMVFSGSNDNTMRAYDVETGAFKQVFSGHKAPIIAIAVCPEQGQSPDHSTEPFAEVQGLAEGPEVDDESKISPELALLTPGKPMFLEGTGSPSLSPGRGFGGIPGSPGSPVSRKYQVKGGKKQPWEESPHSPDKSPFKNHTPMEPFVVTGSKDHTAIIWSLASGKALHSLSGKASPDDQKSTQKKKLSGLEGHSRPVRCVAIDYSIPAVPRVITGSDDDRVKIWSAVSGNVLGTLDGHSAEVRSVSVSSDGRRIVTGSDDKTVKVWDGHEYEELMTLRGHTSSVLHVFLSEDGSSLVSCAEDNTIKGWRFIARHHRKADWLGRFAGAAQGEQHIKSQRISFKECAVVE